MSSWSLTFWMGVATWERWIPHNSGKSRKKTPYSVEKRTPHTLLWGVFIYTKRMPYFGVKLAFLCKNCGFGVVFYNNANCHTCIPIWILQIYLWNRT